MENFKDLWSYCLDLLSIKLNKTTFSTWFEPLELEDVDTSNNIIYLSYTIHPMQKDLIEGRYSNVLSEVIKESFGEHYGVNLILKNSQNLNESEINNQNVSSTSTVNWMFDQENIFNIRNTFDNFIVGKNNEYAHAASFAVAESPAHLNYNPLYIYGEPGLGKTHLMHAIGFHILQNFKNKKVLYVTSEMFTNEFISAIKNKSMDLFRNKYREMDVLLLDDVQFFKGKDTVQEEVFNTFNALHDTNKQIVLSSDRVPSELEISDRLRQRFGWKIIANIGKPDFETRVAILEKKAEQEKLYVDENLLAVINIIATNIKDSVRELESAFSNVLNMAKFRGAKLNTDFLRDNASYLFSSKNSKVDAESIKSIVSQYYGINPKDLESKKKSRDIAYPRQIAVYLVRELTNISFPSIGEYFGNRDHSTMMHAYKKISEEINTQESTKFVVNELIEKIRI